MAIPFIAGKIRSHLIPSESMGRKDDISDIQSTISDLEQGASAIQKKIVVSEAGQKNEPIEKYMGITLVGPPGSG